MSRVLARRDKYEGFKEYWVDVETVGSFEAETAEELTELTHGEGDAGNCIALGLPETAALGDCLEENLEVEDEDGAPSCAPVAAVDAERERALEAMRGVLALPAALRISRTLRKFWPTCSRSSRRWRPATASSVPWRRPRADRHQAAGCETFAHVCFHTGSPDHLGVSRRLTASVRI